MRQWSEELYSENAGVTHLVDSLHEVAAGRGGDRERDFVERVNEILLARNNGRAGKGDRTGCAIVSAVLRLLDALYALVCNELMTDGGKTLLY